MPLRLCHITIAALLCSLFFSSIYAADNGISKVRLIWHEQPATHAVIAWDGDEGSVFYGKRPEKDLKLQVMLTHSTSFKEMNNRFVHLKNLEPDTEYTLEIRTRKGSSKAYWFRSAPAENASFSFIAGGDSRNHRDARQRANTMVSKLRPLFVAFGGDMTSGDSPAEWHAWLDDWELTTGSDGRLIPIIATRGNHERDNESIRSLFDVPNSNIYYTTSIGDNYFRLYTLNSEIEASGAQSAWLAKDVQANSSVQWKLAQYHKPMRPHVSRKRENIRLYQAWAAIFFQYGFNLIMESDSHCAKVTWPIRPSLSPEAVEGFIRDDARGTVFVGEGCWGAPLRPADDNKPWTRDSGSFNQFKWIHVHPDRIDVHTIPVDNVDKVALIDDATPFTAPAGLDFWQPENGAIVTIKPFHDLTLSNEQIKDIELLDIEIVIETETSKFKDSTTVTLSSNSSVDGKLHYTLNGEAPTAADPVYQEAITIDKSCALLAAWITEDKRSSLVFSRVFERVEIPEPLGEKGPAPDVYLDELDWIDQSAGWGETKKNASIGGQPLRLALKEYKRGLGMHSVGHVRYTCKPEWKRFVATVGLGDHVRGNAQASVQVLADNELIYSSPKAFKRYDVHYINVAIPDGTKEIKIVAGDGGNGPGWDNVNIIDAGFVTSE